MFDAYEEGIDLEILIHGVIDEWESQREVAWKENPENYFLDLVDGIAEAILTASDDLVRPGKASKPWFEWDIVRSAAEIDLVGTHVLERIQISIAREHSTDINAKATRCLELTKEVLKQRPTAEVRRFIRRVTRCYIAGFDPECIMLCRAVVENGLIDRYRRAGLPLPATPEGTSGMRIRLDWAKRARWLTADAYRDAWTVWKRGSKAAHEDPEAIGSALETVRMTVRILIELQGGK